MYYLRVNERFSEIYLLSCSSQYQNEKAFCLPLCSLPALLCQMTRAEGSPAWSFPLGRQENTVNTAGPVKWPGGQIPLFGMNFVLSAKALQTTERQSCMCELAVPPGITEHS